MKFGRPRGEDEAVSPWAGRAEVSIARQGGRYLLVVVTNGRIFWELLLQSFTWANRVFKVLFNGLDTKSQSRPLVSAVDASRPAISSSLFRFLFAIRKVFVRGSSAPSTHLRGFWVGHLTEL
jgi:hypothetical protein